jgi:hypothetical protein
LDKNAQVNPRVDKFIVFFACAAAWAHAEVYAQVPEQVHPSTGTAEDLRGIAATVSETVGDYLDQGHDWLYRRAQYFIEDVDTWFAPTGTSPLMIPVSPLRIDFDGDFLHKQSGFGLASARNFDANLRVPNLEHRLGLFITNDSLQETPAVDPAQQQNPVRTGLRLTPLSHVEFEVGVRAKILPSVFGTVRWARDLSAASLHIYPFAKLYAETGSGMGVAGGIGVDRWSGYWVLRSATYVDWIRNKAATDWNQTFIIGNARAVIQERRYDRLADGHDLACGVIAKLAITGDRSSRATLYEANVLFKRPLHGGWLFGYAGPMVRWDRNFAWHPDAGVRLGIDVLFWGLASRTADLTDYCR